LAVTDWRFAAVALVVFGTYDSYPSQLNHVVKFDKIAKDNIEIRTNKRKVFLREESFHLD